MSIVKEYKPIEIFCGTGGVGKTTISTSRAIELAERGKRVLLITIDPAKRLKEILSLKEENAGKVERVLIEGKEIELDALLMSPGETFKWIARQSKASEVLDNRILKILFKPYGGMNEIMAIAEIQKHLNSGHYDTIVLDTPPGSHFIDFLESCGKVNSFFDQHFINIFKILGKKVEGVTDNKILGLIVRTGVKKLLSYLEKVTGKEFVEDFIDAILAFYLLKEKLVTALEIEKDLKSKTVSNWFLVTSVDQNKFSEGIEMHSSANNFIHDDNYIVLNRSTETQWKDWENISDEKIKNVLNSLQNREEKIQATARNTTSNVLLFGDVLTSSPLEQVLSLSEVWKKYGII